MMEENEQKDNLISKDIPEEGENKIEEKVKKALVDIRRGLAQDGGDVELVEVTPQGVVKLKLTGACAHCPMATITMSYMVEAILKEQVPEVKEVRSV